MIGCGGRILKINNAGRLIIAGFCLAALAEGGLRLYRPDGCFRSGKKLSWFSRDPAALERYVPDDELGFKPRFDFVHTTEFGTKPNSYTNKKNAKRRILFLGDSVTARGKIVESLSGLYGTKDFEYWNAGVESFTAGQEVLFYQKHNRAVKPDHVILTFHNNDFDSIPFAWESRHRLHVYAAAVPPRLMHPWLFRNLYLYRLYFGFTYPVNSLKSRQLRTDETEKYILALRNELASQGIEFTVVVHPMLASYETWKEEEKASRTNILRILDELKIKHFDLAEVLAPSFDAKEIIQQSPGDRFHPSATFARRAAEYLYQQHLLMSPSL